MLSGCTCSLATWSVLVPVGSCRYCACGDPARVGAQSLQKNCQVRRRSGFACAGPTGLSGARVRVDVFCVPSDRQPSRFTGVGWPLDTLFSLGCAFGRATASKKPRWLFLTRLNDALPVTIQLTFKLSGAFLQRFQSSRGWMDGKRGTVA